MFEEYFDAITEYLENEGIKFDGKPYKYWAVVYEGGRRDYIKSDFKDVLYSHTLDRMCQSSKIWHTTHYINFSRRFPTTHSCISKLKCSKEFSHGIPFFNHPYIYLITYDKMIEILFGKSDLTPASDDDVMLLLDN